jgi:type VII secretion integral membrane protein EccD
MSDMRPEHPDQRRPARAGLSSQARLARKNLPPGLDDRANPAQRPIPAGPVRPPGRQPGAPGRRPAAGPRTFSRVTVTSSHGRTDVSVPDDLAIADLVVQVRRLLNAPVGTRWVLAHPDSGDLDPDATLADLGILDGELLYLRQHADGFESPYVEDAAEEAAAVQGAAWSAEATARALAALAAVPLALAGPLLLWRFDPAQTGWLLAVLLGAAVSGVLLANLTGGDALAGALALAVPPAGASFAAAGARAAGASPGATLAIVTGAVAAAAALGQLAAGRRQPAMWWLVAMAATATVPAGLWLAMTTAGLPGDRAAALVAVLLVAAQPFLPRLSVELAGLGGVADQAAAGAAVRRQRAQDAARRARLLLVALLTGTAAPTVLLIATLASQRSGAHLALAGLVAAATLLRARRYSQAAHVVPVAASGVAGLLVAAVAAVAAPDGPPAWTVVAVALAVTTVLAALSRLGSAGTARPRGRMLLDRVETLVLIACVPVLAAVLGVYGWVATAFA